MPSDRCPREEYYQLVDQRKTGVHTWDVCEVQVLRKDSAAVLGAYERDYPGKPPFEPFRQRDPDGTDHDYALISPHYEETAVMDLRSGQIVARWDKGFCPAGFYVPDWREVHDGADGPHGDAPGSFFWDERNDRWPDGSLGFVWGCTWGDDNGWKVQAIDLSRVCEGQVELQERWGYLRLADIGEDPSQFIRVEPGEDGGEPRVTFAVPRYCGIGGKLIDSGSGWEGHGEHRLP